MEATLRSQNHLGDDRRLLWDGLYALVVYRLVAVLPGTRTPHERRAGGGCRRNPLLLRLCRSGDWRLALRPTHEAWMDAHRGPQTAGLMRSVRHFGLYGGNGVRAGKHNRPRIYFRFAVPHLYR